MDQSELNEWVDEIRMKTPRFLSAMCSGPAHAPTKYSLTGDLLKQRVHWGLGNTVFALKSFDLLGLRPSRLELLLQHIRSFQNKDGFFSDPWVQRLSLAGRLRQAIKTRSLSNLSYAATKRAETRQALSTLRLFKAEPLHIFLKFPQTEEAVVSFLEKLDWTHPWHAGSHCSHLLYFIEQSTLTNKALLLSLVCNWILKLQREDGAWYRGQPSLAQRINGSMKIITGLRACASASAQSMDVLRSGHQKLIDTALSAIQDAHACDHFNVTYVLRWAASASDNSYRREEITSFMQQRLDLYRKYFFPEHGGFSFELGRANRFYYNAPISVGNHEPDIHGTVLFLWGISTICAFFADGAKGLLREQDA